MTDKLSSPKRVKALKEAFDFDMAKRFGQNFLIDEQMIERIVEGAGITTGSEVLEIGPGMGVLTEAMARVAKKVVAIEIDKRLLPILEHTLSEHSNTQVIQGDVLEVDLARLIDEHFTTPPKVVANLPYYITTPIIMRFLEEGLPVTDLVVMVQKEVAERMVAPPGSKTYGALSVAVQFYAEASKLFKVPRSVFMPQPGVDSMVVRLSIRKEPAVKLADRSLFFAVVRAAFNQRRKTLHNALSSGLGLEKEVTAKILEEAGIDPKRRAESLSMEAFGCIADAYVRKKKNPL